MEPISLILAALLAGMSTGIGSVTADAIKGSYEGLRRALKRKLASEPGAEAVIDGYLADQDMYEDQLRRALWKAGADRDDDIISTARAIVAAVDPRALSEFNVSITDSENIQFGHGNVQFNWDRREVK
jgi:hypothetical protein